MDLLYSLLHYAACPNGYSRPGRAMLKKGRNGLLTQQEMIGLQAESHELIDTKSVRSREDYVLHLIHAAAYCFAARRAENRRVLDLGCNTGYGTDILSRSASSVVGVDVSSRAISAAQALYSSRAGMNFQLIDGQQLPFERGEFDLIVSFQVIEHIVDVETYIRELKRVLAPKGVVMFTTPNATLRLDPGMKPWNEFHVREFTAAELSSLLRKSFSKVAVLGLHAREPFYSIERNRVSRARANARRMTTTPDRHAGYSLRSLARSVIPGSVRAMLRTLRYSLSRASLGCDLDPRDAVARAFFYRVDNPDAALDLLAICSEHGNDKGPI